MNLDPFYFDQKERMFVMLINILRVRPTAYHQSFGFFKKRVETPSSQDKFNQNQNDIVQAIDFLSMTHQAAPLEISEILQDICKLEKEMDKIKKSIYQIQANRAERNLQADQRNSNQSLRGNDSRNMSMEEGNVEEL